MNEERLGSAPKDTVRVIHQEIEDAHKRMEKWHERATKCMNLYRGNGDGVNPDSDRFKILWMITELQRPALYTGGAKADVRRKHLDQDPVARTASQLLERATQCCMDDELHEFDFAQDSAVSDYAIVGRGQTRVVYDAEFEKKKNYLNEDQRTALEIEGKSDLIKIDSVGPYVEGEEVKVDEDAWIEHVHWRDYLHSDGKKEEDVWWKAYGAWLTKEDLKEQFGAEVAENVPTCHAINSDEDKGDYLGYRPGYDDYARVWEFWSKRTGKVYKVAQYYDEFLETPRDDPYGLKGFFPSPRPLDMIDTSGNLEPIPEYKMYEYQAMEANRLTGRIDRLIESIRAGGIYDERLGDLVSKLFEGDDNELIAAENYADFANSGGVSGAISWVPTAEFADALVKLSAQRQSNLDMIFELVGVADIMRGVTNPREAFKTQQLKAQAASGSTSRMRRKQTRVERFVRDNIRLLAEVVGELFDEETLVKKSNLNIPPQALAPAAKLLKSDTPREYKIDVESDTTVAPDDETRKQEFTEFVTAMGGLIGQGMQAAQAGVLPEQLVGQIILFGLRKFKAGRDIEEEIEKGFTEQAEARKQQAGKPSPEEQAAQMKQQIEMQKLELKRQEMMMEAQNSAQKLQLEVADLQQKGQIEMAKLKQKQHDSLMNLITVMINSGQGRPKE
jgi:hypothetical protein